MAALECIWEFYQTYFFKVREVFRKEMIQGVRSKLVKKERVKKGCMRTIPSQLTLNSFCREERRVFLKGLMQRPWGKPQVS